MWEILKALRDLNEACRAHGTRLSWEIDDLGVLKAEIGLTEDDEKFVNDMQAMFAPKET